MQLQYLRHDLNRYFYPNDACTTRGWLSKIGIALTTQGIWATVVYRLRRWAGYECRPRFLRKLLAPFGVLLGLMMDIIAGIHIEPEIDIGPGLYIGHFGGIILGGRTTIGKFANISHGVTIGYAGRGGSWGLPVIGDFVYIAPGAKLIDRIRVGNHVAIGANAVVTKDLPDDAVAVGVPARVISQHSSRDFVQFNRERSRAVLDDESPAALS